MDVAQRNILFGVVGGLAVGGGTGYLVAQKHLAAKYEAQVLNEINSVKATYDKLSKELIANSQKEPLREAVEELLPAAEEEIQEYERNVHRYTAEQIVEVAVGAVTEEDIGEDGMDHQTYNIFKAQQKLLDERDPNKPYLIGIEDYSDPPSGYDSLTVNYYPENNILVDERDLAIDLVEETVGEFNLTQFGQQGNEDHIIYVRNERVQADFEIVRHEGSFMESAFGGSE